VKRSTTTRRTWYHTDLLRAIGKCLPKRGLPLQVADERVRWTPRLLATAAVLLGWVAGPTLAECFAAAREVLVGLYPTRRRPGKTLAGFLRTLSRQSGRWLSVVVASLRQRTETASGRRWRTGPYVVLAADGSRVECPMTRSNERGLGCAGRQKTVPQVFVTCLYHVATGLLWGWSRGRGDASERGQLQGVLGELPPWTLLLMDAGFPGYTLLRSLQRRGHEFIVRVGGNVTLLRKLGWSLRQDGQTVSLWPQQHRRTAPLTLRLVTVRAKGRRVYLLTSVREPHRLSDRQVATLYGQRWGVEVLYRTLKRTLEHHRLRSDTPARAQVELDWYLAGLWMLGLMTRQAQGSRCAKHWSPAKALSAVRLAMRCLNRPRRRGGLHAALRRARADTYVRLRPKASRHYARKKREHPPGRPRIRTATKAEVAAAQKLKQPHLVN